LGDRTKVYSFAEARASNLQFEEPKPIPDVFRDRYRYKLPESPDGIPDSDIMVIHGHESGTDDDDEGRILVVAFERSTAIRWRQAIRGASSGKYDENALRDVGQIRTIARNMLWEADTNGDNNISFKEMMLSITLVHENETDSVLHGEETALLQEKITYLDPWLRANSGPPTESVRVEKEAENNTRPRIDSTEAADSVFKSPAVLVSPKKRSRHRRRTVTEKMLSSTLQETTDSPPPPADMDRAPEAPRSPKTVSKDDPTTPTTGDTANTSETKTNALKPMPLNMDDADPPPPSPSTEKGGR